MTHDNVADQADRLSQRRAHALPILAVLYLAQQFSFFADGDGTLDRAVDQAKVGAWMLLSLILLAALTTKGFWLRRSELRDRIDDEVTRSNRADAVQWGFVSAILAAIGLYLAALIEPVTAREAIHLIVSIGIGAAALRFGLLERRALKDA
jgi:hypothetical protein